MTVAHPTHKTVTASKLPISLQTFHHIMPNAPAHYIKPLNLAMARYSINTGKRIAAFLAQLAVESEELRHTHERWSDRKHFKLSGVHRKAHTATLKEDYFKYWYGNRHKNLGNDTADDGYTYRGRGAIQVTGKANYTQIGLAIGKPLAANPDLVETDDEVDMLASAYFFARLRHLNHVADEVDPHNPVSIANINHRLTYNVNGGYNGEAKRLRYYNKALALMAK